MAAALIETIRHGQASLQNQMLADLGVQRGLISASESAAALVSARPGDLGPQLIESGQLSRAQLATLTDELELLELMETMSDGSAPVAVQQASAEPGRRMGRYVLVEEIGAGGMGVVWKAWDNQLSRWVAIKRLKVKDPKLISRFMREASLLAQLAHPNITAVFEIGVHEGQPFLVMELVNGGSPEPGAMTRKAAAAIVRDAARAVQYAHDRKIIHRDLKPSNLLIGADGRVFVTDFGLARMREEGTTLTVSGALLGTPSFMAPEQAQGKDADYRTDVYGLGAILYALVEGKPPHGGELVHEVVKRVAVANAPTLSGNDDLVVVAQKALERDREDRYQHAGELADELERFIADEPIHARKINSIERTWRRAKRRPVASAIAALVFVSILTAGSWGGLKLENYYARAAMISDATEFTSSGELIVDELRKLYASEDVDPEWETAALRDLDRQADAALAVAPGYSQAEYLKGLVHMWRDEYTAANDRFSAAIADDPQLYEARVYRIVAINGADDSASPELVQDGESFRVVEAPDSDAKAQVIAAIQADAAALPLEHPRRQLASAMLEYTQGDFNTAYGDLHAYLAEHPYDQKVRGLLLWMLLAVRQYEETIEVAEQMVRRDAFPATALSAMAFAYAGMEDPQAAIDAMERSIALRPDLGNEHWIAFWTFELQRFDEAFARYDSILERDPEHVQSLLGRATAMTMLAEAGDPAEPMERARTDAERAIELEPDNAYAHFVLGQATARIDPERAIEAFERAIELDRLYFEAHGNAMIATTQAQLGDMAAAIGSLEHALEIEPDNATWINMLARFHLLNEQPERTIEIVAERTDDADSMLVLASALALQSDYAAALSAAGRAADLRPDDPSVLGDLGYYGALAEDVETAQAAFDAADALAPGDASLLSTEALSWLLVGDYERVLAPAETLAGDGAASAYDFYVLAQAYAGLGRLDDALEALGPAVEAEPSSLEYQSSGARWLAVAGRAGEAERHLPLLLAEPPKFAVRAYLRSMLGQCEAARTALASAPPQDSETLAAGDAVAAACP